MRWKASMHSSRNGSLSGRASNGAEVQGEVSASDVWIEDLDDRGIFIVCVLYENCGGQAVVEHSGLVARQRRYCDAHGMGDFPGRTSDRDTLLEGSGLFC